MEEQHGPFHDLSDVHIKSNVSEMNKYNPWAGEEVTAKEQYEQTDLERTVVEDPVDVLFEPDDNTEEEDNGIFDNDTDIDKSDAVQDVCNNSETAHDDTTETDDDSTTSEEIIPSKRIRISLVPETQRSAGDLDHPINHPCDFVPKTPLPSNVDSQHLHRVQTRSVCRIADWNPHNCSLGILGMNGPMMGTTQRVVTKLLVVREKSSVEHSQEHREGKCS